MDVVDLSDHMDPVISKKRRFFAEDSPEKLVEQENTLAASSPLHHDTNPFAQNEATAGSSGFDADLLESLVGEKLEQDVVQRLRELSGDNIERGRIGRLGKGSFG
jgi:hypothetical protein